MVLHPLQNRKFPSIYIKPGWFNSVHLYECNTPQKITECSNLSLKVMIESLSLTYMLWFSFILGLNFISLCFKLVIIHYHTRKQKEIKFKPRIKLNHKIYSKRQTSDLSLALEQNYVHLTFNCFHLHSVTFSYYLLISSGIIHNVILKTY